MERIGKRIFQVILIGGTINVTHILRDKLLGDVLTNSCIKF
jgi:hypothetical protein